MGSRINYISEQELHEFWLFCKRRWNKHITREQSDAIAREFLRTKRKEFRRKGKEN